MTLRNMTRLSAIMLALFGLTLLAACAESDDGVAPSTSSDAASADTSSDVTTADAGDAPSSADVTVTEDAGPTCPAPDGVRPSRRSEHAGIYDPLDNRIVFYGGSFAIPENCSFAVAHTF